MLKTLLAALLLTTSVNASEVLKVGVIDTGLDLTDPRFADVLCPSGHKDFTDTVIDDNDGHGTHVVGLIKKYAADVNYCIVIYKYYSPFVPGSVSASRLVSAIRAAINEGVKIINLSAGGYNFNEMEYLAIKNAPEVLVVAAAGNDGQSRVVWYPAGYALDNVVAVGATGLNGARWKSSNFGDYVSIYELGESVLSTLPQGKEGRMSGTSMAAATHTGKVVNKMAGIK